MSLTQKRIRVVYSGRVQGVGFRATAQGISEDFSVRGFVRNCADGTVELEAQGEAGEIQRFLDAIAARLGHYIRSVDWQPAAPRADERDFEIRY